MPACADYDRGGMRGIVILEVLRHVQEELGGRIPIQDFFDLVVGTRLVLRSCSIRRRANTDCMNMH